MNQDITDQSAAAELAATILRLQKEKEQTALLLNISQTVSETLDLKQILRDIGKALHDYGEYWGIYLVDQETYISLYDPDIHTDSGDDAFTLEILKRKSPISVFDAAQDPFVAQERTKRYGFKSILGLPMMVKDRVVAVAVNVTIKDYRSFTPEEIEFAQKIVNIAALAVENARLHQEVEQLAMAKERANIARELHDTSDQLVTGVLFEIQAAQESIRAGQSDSAMKEMETAKQIVRQIDSYNHLIISGLRPVVLNELDLVPALRWYAETFQERYKLACTFRVIGHPFAMKANVETAIYRIVQEALNNVILHARAKIVEIEVDYSTELVRVSITDDGVGFDACAFTSGGLIGGGGLKGMRDRIQSAGGQFEVDTMPDQGTRLVITAPANSVPATNPGS